MTNLRWTKFISCAKEWIKLSGGDREIAERSEAEGLPVNCSRTDPNGFAAAAASAGLGEL